MAMSDPIADMLTRIRNAVRLGAPTVSMPSSRLKLAIAEALMREGFIGTFGVAPDPAVPARSILKIELRYGPNGERVIQFIDRVSRPGRRVYAAADGLPRILSGMGCSILSTSKGVKSDRECKRDRVGGEILCRVG